MRMLNNRNLWLLSSGSMVAGASLLFLKKGVRQKASKTGELMIKKGSEWTSVLTKVPSTVTHAWKANRKKCLILVNTLSDEVKKLQLDTTKTGEHVYKAYLSGIKAVDDIKDIKFKTKAILSGQQHSLAHDGKQQVKLGEAVNSMSVQSLS